MTAPNNLQSDARPQAVRARGDAGTPAPVVVPDKPALEGLEQAWAERWEAWQTYRFDRSKTRDEVYSIDTPPPTASGSLHVGHVFSYTQTDILARFQRMAGREVFYPIGWDDNGLPTERRVQNYYGVRCDPSVPYDAHLELPATPGEQALAISRPNFVALCNALTVEDEVAFEQLFRLLGLSVDWSQQYTTVGEHARRTSQGYFLDMHERDQVYRQEAPTLWDVDFQSAIAQAELEDREVNGAYHAVRFTVSDGTGFVDIETTRPELIPACVALVAHPDDERYRPLFGKTVLSPLFAAPVEVLAHRLAEPDKGSGIAMVCTFGDLTDVTWWRELALPTRTVVGRDGRFEAVGFGGPEFPSLDPDGANRAYGELAGRTVRQAQRRIVELLAEAGALIGEPRPIRHSVKYYERGDRPLEIVSSRQWYVRTMAMRDELIAGGREITWHPAFMRARYESWVEGLTGDWNISRQRFFGVPFPLWYPVRADGTVDDGSPILPERADLPIDPSTDVPAGYRPEQRGEPGGFVADPDVLDTWATSSLTPQIAGHAVDDPDLFGRVFPMDVRPQAHEIIRTWLFATVVRARLAEGVVPWHHAAISGWILDPDRKKMSKSKGNVVVPTDLLDKHGTDAVRYWAASARLGTDTVFDERQMAIGRRLSIKILNASKFVLSRLAESQPDDAEATLWPLDAALLTRVGEVTSEATRALENYEHARALERTEQFFWSFCDDYLELVKVRVYGDGPGAASARRALGTTLSVLLRLFAPFLPFVTEEAWSWWHETSLHRAPWPSGDLADPDEATSSSLLEEVGAVLSEVRRAKTAASASPRTAVREVVVTGPADRIERIAQARDELAEAGNVATFSLVEDESSEIAVRVELAS